VAHAAPSCERSLAVGLIDRASARGIPVLCAAANPGDAMIAAPVVAVYNAEAKNDRTIETRALPVPK